MLVAVAVFDGIVVLKADATGLCCLVGTHRCSSDALADRAVVAVADTGKVTVGVQGDDGGGGRGLDGAVVDGCDEIMGFVSGL